MERPMFSWKLGCWPQSYGPEPFVRDPRDPWGNPRPSGIRKYFFFVWSKCWVFVGREPTWFLGIVGSDRFARVDSSGDQNPTIFVPHLHVFVELGPPLKIMNPDFFKPLQNLVPWDHAQMIERSKTVPSSRAKASVRPNPTLVFVNHTFPILSLLPPPQNYPSNTLTKQFAVSKLSWFCEFNFTNVALHI